MEDKNKTNNEEVFSEHNENILEQSQQKNTENKNISRKKTTNLNSHKSHFLRGVAIGVVLTFVFFAGYFTHYFSLSKEIRSIEFLLDIYKQHYYKASESDVVHTLAEGLLDIYSGYYTAEEYEAYQKAGQGSKSGYGIGVLEMKITSVLGNSPAEKAGIKAGGTITAYKLANAEEFITVTTQDAFTAFLSSTDEEVTLKILYGEEYKEFTLKRAEYTENYVYYTDASGSYRFIDDGDGMVFTLYEGENIQLGAGWAYLKFTSFNGLQSGTMGGSGQFAKALETFKANANDKLIIDLRGNGGGYMSILCNIASHLCDTGSTERFIVQKARYRDGRIENFYSLQNDYANYNFTKIVFLADSGSASASEALMGAVLDYDKLSGNNIVRIVLDPTEVDGKVVYRSYGKGIMQSMYTNYLTGEAVKLTTAEVIWPVTEGSIHGVGFTPETDSRVYAAIGDAISFAQTL